MGKYSWKSLDEDHCKLNDYLVDMPMIERAVSKANAAQLHIGNQALPNLQRYVERLHNASEEDVLSIVLNILISLKDFNNIKVIHVPDNPFKNWTYDGRRWLRSENGAIWMNYEFQLDKSEFVGHYGSYYRINEF